MHSPKNQLTSGRLCDIIYKEVKMKIEKIENIKKRFKKEWLLIKVTEFDKTTSTSIKGRLIAHSPNRDEIYKRDISYKGFTLIDYSEDKLPKGYAAAF